MSAKIKWFNVSDVVPEDDNWVIGDDGESSRLSHGQWYYSMEEGKPREWRHSRSNTKGHKKPIRWAHIPEWSSDEAPTKPGVYHVFKDGVRVEKMWIPDQGEYVARYFGWFVGEKRPWFDFSAHIFEKVDDTQ